MTTEEKFRADLHDAVNGLATNSRPVDAGALVATGTKVVRRRRAAAIGGSLAAVALIAVVGGQVVGNLGAAPEQPPAGTTSNPEVSSATVALPPSTSAPDAATDYVVKIGQGAGGVPESDLGYYRRASDGSLQLLGGSSTEGLTGKSTLGYGGGDVVIGIVPDDAVAVSLVPGYDGDTGGFGQSELTAIPGTGFSAVAFRLNKVPTAELPDFRPLWWRSDGTPVTNDGPGSVVRFDAKEGAFDVWAIPDAGLIGDRTPGGNSLTTLSSLWADGPVAELDLTSGYQFDATQRLRTVAGDLARAYLIKGHVREVKGQPADGVVSRGSVEAQYWPELNATVVFAQARLPETTSIEGQLPKLLAELTWTDADGKTQSYQPRP